MTATKGPATATALKLAALTLCLHGFMACSHTPTMYELHRAAHEGDAPAQALLALRYYRGDGVPQSHAAALKWFKKAAAQNYSEAQFMLATMYYKGEGVPQDHDAARLWFRIAAAQGHPEAKTMLIVINESADQ